MESSRDANQSLVNPPAPEIPFTPVPGYRRLSAAEIALMSAIKEHEAATLAFVQRRVKQHVAEQRAAGREAAGEQKRLDAAEPERWVALARTHFQEGYMALVRAVAQPAPLDAP